jgi:hypothetical protein
MHAPLQIRKPAASQRAPRQSQARRIMQPAHARGGEPRHGALSTALNTGIAVQRLARIRERVNAPRQSAREISSEPINAAPASQSGVAQATFFVAPAPNNVNALNQKAQTNWNAAINYLADLGQHVVPDLLVNVTNINTGGRNPADTNYIQATDTINIRIQNWYLEMASVGDLMGMLTHEIGVHSLAQAEMTPVQIGAETLANPNAAQVQVGGANFPLAGQQAVDARQMDHVNAVKDQAVGVLSDRGQVYLNTFLRMGDAIEADNAIGQPEKTRRQRDLLDTFLLDIGRLLATDDGGAIRGLTGVPGATALASRAIAQVMNWYRNTYLVPQYAAHAWLNQVPLQQVMTGPRVFGMLFNKLVDYGVTRVKSTSTMTKGLLGAAGVGAVAAGIAFAPVTTLAVGGAALAYGAYRYFWG